jgi:HprK-related kinase A
MRVGSAWPAPITDLARLYRDYPAPDSIPDYTVRLDPTSMSRRWFRPSIIVGGDYNLVGTSPLPLSLGLIAAEMAMNLQLALGERRFLLLHASAVERDGRAVIMTGESGAGKSTLSALLMGSGWRFLGDEFVLLEPETGLMWPYPRPISLKNASIAPMCALFGEERFGPELRNTPKGTIRHLRPDVNALRYMDETARPATILFPRYGFPLETRRVGRGEAFVRLTQASTNYAMMGERGFAALTTLVMAVPSIAVDYPDSANGVATVEAVWQTL